MTMLRERLKQRTCKADNINESHRGGQARSSDEVTVMVMERRGLATMLRPRIASFNYDTSVESVASTKNIPTRLALFGLISTLSKRLGFVRQHDFP